MILGAENVIFTLMFRELGRFWEARWSFEFGHEFRFVIGMVIGKPRGEMVLKTNVFV